jgi:hypothetical protein
MNVGLVACCKQKLTGSAPARRLYTSSLFRKASAYCEVRYDAWFILSAKYGLVAPDLTIESYDCTLLGQKKADRVAWGLRVVEQIKDRGLEHAIFFFHAGKAYFEPLAAFLTCSYPLKGLGIGRQLAWYLSRRQSRTRS